MELHWIIMLEYACWSRSASDFATLSIVVLGEVYSEDQR